MPHADSHRSDGFDTHTQQVGALYAKALLGATEAGGQTAQVLDELDSFVSDVLEKMPDFDAVLSSALVSHEDKVALLDRALEKQASDIFLNFLKVVSGHGRLDCLRAIRWAAHKLYDEMSGRIPVEVRTARPLDEASVTRLTERLQTMLGGQPELRQKTDPDLIGGIVLRVGDTVYDGSIANGLKQVRGQMLNRSVHEIQSRRDSFSHPAGD